jgi:hypothetical protein
MIRLDKSPRRLSKRSGSMHVPAAARPMSGGRLGDHRRTSGVIGQAVRQSGNQASHRAGILLRGAT